jgi:hypothetical protein
MSGPHNDPDKELSAAEKMAEEVKLMETRDWLDAFAVTLECNVASAMNPELLQQVIDAEKHIRADLVAATSDAERDQLSAALGNQRHILHTMKAFNLESHNAMMVTFRAIREDFLKAAFDLRRNVDFEGRPNGELWARQGKGPWMKWSQDQGHVVLAFMRWVYDKQTEVRDPGAYTRKMLEQQGITRENFHEHADKLAIRNPWGESVIVTDHT